MKSKLCQLVSMYLVINFSSASGQLPDSIRIHLDSSLAVLKNNSLYAKQVDWKTVEQRVFASAQAATTRAQTFEALKIAFEALGDKHAAYYQYADQYKLANPGLMARYSDSIKVAWSRGPKINSRMIDDIAYLSVPFMGVGKQTDIDRYANRLYEAVLALHAQKPRGWIVDLRLNGGGNIRPMLAGLSVFFEDGVVGHYLDRDGNATDALAFHEGNFMLSGVKQATLTSKGPYFNPVNVAVLIGPGTASSGEGVAAVFKERKQTRLFGERSAGLANSTDGFVFNNNHSYFLLSVAALGNKHKQALPESIEPDVLVKSNDSFGNLTADSVVKAAVNWLK